VESSGKPYTGKYPTARTKTLFYSPGLCFAQTDGIVFQLLTIMMVINALSSFGSGVIKVINALITLITPLPKLPKLLKG
jgi:hypothetical protein